MIVQDGTKEAGDTVANPTFVFRRIDLGTDVPRLVRLNNEIQAADGVGERTNEANVYGTLTRPGVDLSRDRWVIEAPGDADRLIGYSGAWRGENAEGAYIFIDIHPDWRRRGLGSALLERSLARARELGAARANIGADDREVGKQAFLRKHGFAPTATWVVMRAPASTSLAAPALPPGYQVRPYSEVQDPGAFRTAINRGFIGHYQHRDMTEAEIAHWLQKPGLRPEGIFLAFGPAGDVAGVCWADISAERSEQRGEPTGYINDLAVVPEHRRRGLGRALLLAGMQWLRAHGQGAVELDAWGHNEMAVPLYEQVGFVVVEQGQQYQRAL